MSIDLSAAIEAAARVAWRAWNPDGPAWHETNDRTRSDARNEAGAMVTAAAPLIEAAVREQVARDIEAEHRVHSSACGESPAEPSTWHAGNDRGISFGLLRAATIARGES